MLRHPNRQKRAARAQANRALRRIRLKGQDIRWRDQMNKVVLNGAMHEVFKLRLWSGLPARLYRLDNPLVMKTANACSCLQPQRLGIPPNRRCRYHVIVVDVVGDEVSIVYLNEDTLSMMFKTAKRGRINLRINRDFSPRIVVYNGAPHHFDRTAKLLEAAITRKINPSLSVLVFQDKLEGKN
jgi:hypothetical protein